MYGVVNLTSIKRTWYEFVALYIAIIVGYSPTVTPSMVSALATRDVITPLDSRVQKSYPRRSPPRLDDEVDILLEIRVVLRIYEDIRFSPPCF